MGGGVERALVYAVVVGMVNMLGMAIVLNNMPIAVFAGTLIGVLAMLRGVAAWA